MKNRKRYTANDVQNNIFYQLPKFLLEGEYKYMSNDARVLYALMRNRHELSLKNEWVNSNNEVYIYFTRAEMCDQLNLTDKTVKKVVTELTDLGLIDETRQGLGRPNMIYLLNPENPINPKNPKNTKNPKNPETRKISYSYTEEKTEKTEKSDIPDSETGDFTVVNSEISQRNYNNNKENEFKETYIKSDQIKSDQIAPEENFGNKADEIKTDEIRCDLNAARLVVDAGTEEGQKEESLPNVPPVQGKTYLGNPPTKYSLAQVVEIVKENIDYDCLLVDRVAGEKTLDEIVHVIATTICSDFKDGYISMGEERMPAEAVKSVFFKLNMMDIQYFVRCFKRVTSPITKLTSYIRTSLFRNYGTASHYWANLVNVDYAR